MPLTFEMPMEALETYQGTNPRPDDFDQFWADGLDQLDRIDPDVEIVASDFQTSFADCFDLYFTGVANARIHAKYVRPKPGDDPHPAILQFHGYADKIGDWADGPMLAFAAQGFSYVGMDCRGQGGGSQDTGTVQGNTVRGHIVRGLDDAINGRPENLLFRNIYLDTVQIARIVMNMDDVDPTRVGAWGGSQGGGLSVACAALEPRIRRVAPLYPFLSDFQRVWEMDQAKDAYFELQDWFRRNDPLHKKETEVFNALGYIDIQHLAGRLKCDVLWRMGLMDTVCPPSTQFAAYNKITSPKSLEIYPDFGHERLPLSFDHLFDFMRDL